MICEKDLVRREEPEEERKIGLRGKGVKNWDLKASTWNLSELNQEVSNHFISLVSGSVGEQNKKGGFLLDFKLGRFGDIGNRSENKVRDQVASKMVSLPSGSLKKARVPNGTRGVSCLVDGCKSDLSICREYHRRHRVCERHSKTPIVIIRGEEQRFCQQCSRFHSLGEFDEGKRSCRKRLDGHNRRRRKPQPESLYMSSGSFLTSHQGTRFLQFSSPQIHATTTVRSHTWPMIASSEAEAMICDHHQQLGVNDRQCPPNSLPCIYNGGNKQFPFLQVQENVPIIGNQAGAEVFGCGPLFNGIASSENGRESYKMSTDEKTPTFDSYCALSLLSSHPIHTSGICMSHLVPPQVRPIGLELQYNGVAEYSWSLGIKDEPVHQVLVPDANENIVHSNGLLGNRASQILPNSWE